MSYPINPQTIMILYNNNLENDIPVYLMCNPNLFQQYKALLSSE